MHAQDQLPMGTGASLVNGASDNVPPAASVARLVLLPPGEAHGIRMEGTSMVGSTLPVITALEEGGRAAASRSFVLGDRISHINPKLAGDLPHSAVDVLGDAAAATSELGRLRSDSTARVWVRRTAHATPVVCKPSGGIFGVTWRRVVES